MVADLTDEADIDRLVDRTAEAVGRVDVLVNNISSENGEQPYPDMMAYSASKGALNNFPDP